MGAQVDTETADLYSRRKEEVRIKVRLANAGDEMLCRRKKLAKSKVRSVEVEAVVDTGAVRSCIPETIMLKLGLMEQGRQVARDADGRTDTVITSEPATLYMLDRDVSENFLVVGDEVLIGQTALAAAAPARPIFYQPIRCEKTGRKTPSAKKTPTELP